MEDEEAVEMEWTEGATRHILRVAWDDSVNEIVASAAILASPESETVFWTVTPEQAQAIIALLQRHLIK